jgi:hypothetical protein
VNEWTIVVDSHQGKHIAGRWPSYNGGKKNGVFHNNLVSWNNLSFFEYMWREILSVPSAVSASGSIGSGLIIMTTSEPVEIDHGEIIETTQIVVNWVQPSSSCKTIEFHATPQNRSRPNKGYHFNVLDVSSYNLRKKKGKGKRQAKAEWKEEGRSSHCIDDDVYDHDGDELVLQF